MRVQTNSARYGALSLKARLLLGAAGLTLAAQPGTALAEQKWEPHIDVGGKVGNDRAIGQVDLFVPIWQDSDTLLFGNVRGRFDDSSSEEGNFGLGLRERINPDWVLGVYGFYDVQSSAYDNTFHQFAAGIEFLSEDWDFRFNGYLAEDDLEIVPGLSQVVVQGTSIQIFNGVEGALSGFDIEAGYRVYHSDNIEGRVFIGGFYFDHDDLEEVAGPRLRGEARIFDLDLLGPQSRLTVSAELSHDDVRDTTVFGGLSLRVPFSAITGSQRAPFQGLDRRMVDPIQRDVDIVTTTTNTLPQFTEDLFLVLPNGKAGDFDTVIYFDKTGGGAGTYDDPTDFLQATFDANPGAIFVGLDATGDISAPGLGIALLDEQVVLGGGTTILAQGENTGIVVPFTFDGARPTILGTNAASDTFTLANYNVLENLNLGGAFDTAIYGNGVTGFVVRDIDVDGSAGGYEGFAFYAGASGDFTGDIGDFSVSKVSGNAVEFYLYFADGLASTADFDLSGLAIDGVDGTTVDSGLVFDTFARDGSKLDVALAISDVTVNNVDSDGLRIDLQSYGAGSATVGDISVSDFVLTDTAGEMSDGIEIEFDADYRASTTGDLALADISLTATGYSGNASEGLYIEATAYAGGYVSQTVSATNISVIGENFVEGVELDVDGYGFDTTTGKLISSVANQTINISGLTIEDSEDEGLFVDGSAGSAALITQDITVKDLVVTGVGDQGVEIDANAYGAQLYAATVYQAVMTQYVTVTGGSVTGSGDEGIEIAGFSGNSGRVDQAVALTDVTVEGNGTDGLNSRAGAYGVADFGGTTVESYISQLINVTGGSFSDNGGNGLFLYADADDGGVASQGLQLLNTSVNDNTYDGLELASDALDGLVVGGYFERSEVIQSAYAKYSTFSGNGADGIVSDAVATDGGQVDLLVVLYGSAVDANGADGINLVGNSSGLTSNGGTDYRSSVELALVGYSGSDVTNHAAGDGIIINGTVTDEAELGASLVWSGDSKDPGTISSNSGNGIVVNVTATKGGAGEIEVEVSYAEIVDNGGSGLVVAGLADDLGATTKQNTSVEAEIVVSDSTVTGNVNNGVAVQGAAASTADDVSVDFGVGLFDSTFDGNGGAGATAAVIASGALAVADLYLISNPSSFSDNGIAGLRVAAYAEFGADTEANVIVDDATMTGNGGGGAFLIVNAADGASAEMTATLTGATVSDNLYGIYGVVSSFDTGSDATLDINVESSTVQSNAYSGISISGYAGDAATSTADLVVDDTVVTGNAIGVLLVMTVDDATGAVDGVGNGFLTLEDSTIADNATGVRVEFDGQGYGSFYGDVRVIRTTIGAATVPAAYGPNTVGLQVDVQQDGDGYGFVSVEIDESSLDGNGNNALISNSASNDGYARLDVDVDDSTFDNGTYGPGVLITNTATDVGSVANVGADFNTVSASGNAGTGIEVRSSSSDLAAVFSSVTSYALTLTGNTGSGFESQADVTTAGYGSVFAQLVGTFSDNGGDGVTISAVSEDTGSYLRTFTDVTGVVTGNAYNGVQADASALGGGDVGLYIDVDADVSKNGANGVDISTAADGAGSVAFGEHDIAANADYNVVGIRVANSATNGAGAYFEVNIVDSSANKVSGGTGIVITNTAATGGTAQMLGSDIEDTTANFNTVGISITNADADGTGTADMGFFLQDVQAANVDTKQFSTGMRFINQGAGATQDIDGDNVDVDPNTVGFFIQNAGGGTQTGTITDAQYLDTLIPFAGGTFGIVITPGP